MSVMLLAPVIARSRPGTWVTSIWPGEKPSLRFHSVGRIGIAARLDGMPRTLRFTRSPVSVLLSAVVKKLLGQGKRQ